MRDLRIYLRLVNELLFYFQSEDGSADEDLLTGELDTAGDATDSEHEDEAGTASDHEQDVILQQLL